jgi:hypothetical protein
MRIEPENSFPGPDRSRRLIRTVSRLEPFVRSEEIRCGASDVRSFRLPWSY